MSRPLKQTVDYFPHFTNSGKTIFILMNKYGHLGYAFWFMLLELLARSDGHFYDCSEEADWQYLLAFTRVSEVDANNIIADLVRLGKIDKKLWEEKKIVWCQSFVDHLQPLYARRNDSPQKPFSNNITDNKNEVENELLHTKTPLTRISEGKNPQSKVKKSKVNKSIVDNNIYNNININNRGEEEENREEEDFSPTTTSPLKQAKTSKTQANDKQTTSKNKQNGDDNSTPPSSALTSVDTLGAEIKKEEMYIETIAQDIGQQKRVVETAIDEFVTFLKLTDEPMKSRSDFKRHFLYWVRKQDFKRIKELSLLPTPEEYEEFYSLCGIPERRNDMKRILDTYTQSCGVTPREAITHYKSAVKKYGDLSTAIAVSELGRRRLQ